jgi:hypothetical protein
LASALCLLGPPPDPRPLLIVPVRAGLTSLVPCPLIHTLIRIRSEQFLYLFTPNPYPAVRDLLTADAWDGADGQTELVFIGRGLDREAYAAAFAVCVTAAEVA